MIIRFTRPDDLATRKQAIRAGQIVSEGMWKVEWHNLAGEFKRSEAIVNDLCDYITSQKIDFDHLFWAVNELRRHADGGWA